MKQLWVVIHRIFEPEGPLGLEVPVVEHRFHGQTAEEAQHYFQSHMKTDSFMRDCQTRGKWKDVVCPSNVTLERLR